MKNCIDIAVTGYFGSGSSAVIDLLREYNHSGVVPAIGRTYEHVAFYYPGGLFDLCTLLSNGNTPQGSDMAINHFLDSMKRLNDNNFDWFGSYKHLFGDSFMDLVNNFVSEISEIREGSTSYHVLSSRFSPTKAIIQQLAHLFIKRKFTTFGKVYRSDGKDVYFSMPSKEELYSAAKRFTSGYFSLFDKYNYNIYDHLIWPQQVNVQGDCFADNFKVIIVRRDPRDVFLLSKYYWCKPPVGKGKPHFGDNVHKFVEEWKRTVILKNENPNALHINFEDLIYNYEETVEKIECFIGLPKSEHINRGQHLDPPKSIENTQAFRANEKWVHEASVIETELPNYLYSFPYERVPSISKMFDSPNR